jgi:hypothetical protein
VLEEYAHFNLTSQISAYIISFSFLPVFLGVGWVGVKKNGKSGDGNKAYPPQHKQI